MEFSGDGGYHPIDRGWGDKKNSFVSQLIIKAGIYKRVERPPAPPVPPKKATREDAEMLGIDSFAAPGRVFPPPLCSLKPVFITNGIKRTRSWETTTPHLQYSTQNKWQAAGPGFARFHPV